MLRTLQLRVAAGGGGGRAGGRGPLGCSPPRRSPRSQCSPRWSSAGLCSASGRPSPGWTGSGTSARRPEGHTTQGDQGHSMHRERVAPPCEVIRIIMRRVVHVGVGPTPATVSGTLPARPAWTGRRPRAAAARPPRPGRTSASSSASGLIGATWLAARWGGRGRWLVGEGSNVVELLTMIHGHVGGIIPFLVTLVALSIRFYRFRNFVLIEIRNKM